MELNPEVEAELEALKAREREEKDRLLAEQAAMRSFKLIHEDEQKMLATFPEEERPAVLAFVRWSAGKDFVAGIKAKLAAKGAFIAAFAIARELYLPAKIREVKEKKSSLILPGDL